VVLLGQVNLIEQFAALFLETLIGCPQLLRPAGLLFQLAIPGSELLLVAGKPARLGDTKDAQHDDGKGEEQDEDLFHNSFLHSTFVLYQRGTGHVPASRSGKPRQGSATDTIASPHTTAYTSHAPSTGCVREKMA
jgi:hypothetical protein